MKKESTIRIHNLQRFFKIIYFFEVFVIAILMIVFLVAYSGILKFDLDKSYFILFAVMLMILLILNVYELLYGDQGTKKFQNIVNMQEDALLNIEHLNKEMRQQRHDFLNHLQVIYSLLELNEVDETLNYLNKTYGDIIKLNANIKTKKVAINALLQAKFHEAEKRGIGFEVVIRSDLERMDIPEWELCRVIGNIVDNAIYILSDIKNPRIKIEISEILECYKIKIGNNGPIIPENIIKHIFEDGFTTKSDCPDEHGMGLFIAKDLIEIYKGKIETESITDWTCFTVTINKEKQI